MALPPKFAGHRLTFDTLSPSGASAKPLHTLEIFLDYTCPFSANLITRALRTEIFRTLTSVVIPHIRATPSLSSSLQLIFRHQIQPWHPTSTLAHEAALAVLRLTDGDPDKFWAFSAALFDAQKTLFDEAVVDETRNQTYRRLAKLAAETVGVNEEQVYKLLEIKKGEGEPRNVGNGVTVDVKFVVKMARLVSVHVSPTVLFDGVVQGDISSSWTGEQWKEWLEKNIV
ncbi:uncharacterized protein CTHT_0055090 [Thermochaetoides thermophila DSM 1495]|uniref:Thioredoxin-like fold domain-containing protein n=1 Tax=Chaetomium thermophilum (strain DSM 1495 / CBS 144.50 / IMI 039719) TaxID=759272 RepID=G0SBX0_CHATD|nr:hypothetical protein CTHT_0055090 [Thermochaetoides thermophila DSM 1495]EGS18896.1 hypothetical protein CTHT_0055090 [Thermochaetoides thermophila DSM 1495]